MSRIRIVHHTTYGYAKPVKFGLHRLVIRPRDGHDVLVESHKLTIKPDSAVTWHRDLFGNSVAMVQFFSESDSLDIVNDVVVVRRDENSHEGLLDVLPVTYPFKYSELEVPVASGYQTPVYLEEAAALLDWATATFHPKQGADAVQMVLEIMDWIYRTIGYRRREDRGVQTPMETLQLGTGSCRDMATLMLETVRAFEFAARFVSGYLDSQAAAAGRAATHAWVEVYFPDHGWFGCDPTLGEGTSFKHIVTGVSSHPRGVMPVVGAYSGDKEVYEGMTVSVNIEKLPTPAQSELQ